MNNIFNVEKLDKQLAQLDLSLAKLRYECSLVVLFGSQAARCSNVDSDWDIFCISNSKTTKSHAVDIVRASPNRIRTTRWLGSELANHIAYYGQVLHGHFNWKDSVFVSNSAIEKKCSRIQKRVENLSPLWSRLAKEYRRKHYSLLANDVLRASLMCMNQPVPPTPLLQEVSRVNVQDALCTLVRKRVLDELTKEKFGLLVSNLEK